MNKRQGVMCDSRLSSGYGSFLEGRKVIWRRKLQALNNKGERAPFIYLVKKARCRGFVQCVTFVFKQGGGVSVIVCVRRHVYIY